VEEEDVVVMLLSCLAALVAKLRRALLPRPLVMALCISEAGVARCCCSIHAVRSVLVRMLRPRRAAHGLALAAMAGSVVGDDQPLDWGIEWFWPSAGCADRVVLTLVPSLCLYVVV